MSDGLLDYLTDLTGGRLGRNVLWHDPQNRAWAARGVLFDEGAPIEPRVWWARHMYDQGHESSCTMQAAAGLLATSPNRLVLPRENLTAYDEPQERYQGYRRAQSYDPWPGEAYEGSSTDAPLRMLRDAEQRIREWRWCFGVEDVLRTLSYHGPVAIGTYWYSAMDTPTGYWSEVKAEGSIRGGHAYMLVSVGDSYVDAINSWGRSYGRNGRIRMSHETLERLLNQDGEAVTIVL